MRYLILIAMFSMAVVASTDAEETLVRDPSIAQLKVFDNYVGKWDFQMKSAQVVDMVGEMETAWIHGGKLIRQAWTMDADGGKPPITGENIMTYDIHQNVYRQWSYNSYGETSESVGTWDKEKNTMVWTGKDSMGNDATTTSIFAAEDREEYTIKVTSKDGEVLADISGTTTRK